MWFRSNSCREVSDVSPLSDMSITSRLLIHTCDQQYISRWWSALNSLTSPPANLFDSTTKKTVSDNILVIAASAFPFYTDKHWLPKSTSKISLRPKSDIDGLNGDLLVRSETPLFTRVPILILSARHWLNVLLSVSRGTEAVQSVTYAKALCNSMKWWRLSPHWCLIHSCCSDGIRGQLHM
jgi:hypothetical protein